MKQFRGAPVVLALLALGLPGFVWADSIIGTVNVTLGSVGVSLGGTDFFSYDPGTFSCDTNDGFTAPGCFLMQPGAPAAGGPTGNFIPLVAAQGLNAAVNTIQDLPTPPNPLSGPDAIPGFIKFDNGAGAGGITFDLTTILPGTGPDCTTINMNVGGASCTIYTPFGVSPYTLTNNLTATAVTVGASMYFNGYSGNPANGTTPYIGVFSTQVSSLLVQGNPNPINPVDIATIFNVIINGGETTSTWNASFAPLVPEPAAFVLAGLGLMGIGFLRRRR